MLGKFPWILGIYLLMINHGINFTKYNNTTHANNTLNKFPSLGVGTINESFPLQSDHSLGCKYQLVFTYQNQVSFDRQSSYISQTITSNVNLIPRNFPQNHPPTQIYPQIDNLSKNYNYYSGLR